MCAASIFFLILKIEFNQKKLQKSQDFKSQAHKHTFNFIYLCAREPLKATDVQISDTQAHISFSFICAHEIVKRERN